MKTYSLEALDALRSGSAIVSGAVWFGGVIETGFWGGYGNIVLDGRAYVGIGDKGLIEASGGTLGGQELGAQLTLSGVDPNVVGLLDLKALRGVPVMIYRLVFNGSGATLLHAAVYLRGRVDAAPVEETPGGASTIRIGIEGAARGLGRRSERMRTDADQRLIAPNDGSFRRVSYAGEKVVTWGGKPPERAGPALGGIGPSPATGGRGGGGGDAGVTSLAV